MITNDGCYDPTWLNEQTTETLRQCASAEQVRYWETVPRHTLVLALGQLRVAAVATNESEIPKTNTPQTAL